MTRKSILSALLVLLVCALLCLGSWGMVAMAETAGETVRFTGTISDFPDNEEVFERYLDNLFGLSPRLLRVSRLAIPEEVQPYFNFLKACVQEVAAGERTSTEFTMDGGFTLDEDGLSVLLNALLTNCPYDLYWFDKTQGYSIASDGYTTTFSFYVAQEYAAGTFEVDPTPVLTAQSALERVEAILNDYAAASDYRKLCGYKEEICALVSYNYDAAGSGSMDYGNPWQLVWVFDDNPDTNVVCEGYSKAFQYLCDRSGFAEDVSCSSVTGFMNGGAHMWNLIRMPDEKVYMADVTNCDADMVGADDLLFLAGRYSGSVDEGYVFRCEHIFGYDDVSYVYDSETRRLFSDDELTMADSRYVYQEPIQGEVVVDGIRYNLTDEGAKVIGYEGNPVDLVIPESVQGQPVVMICADAFSGCQSLRSVSIPRTVQELEDGEYTLDNFTYVSHGAFASCPALASVYIPEDSVLSYIGKCSFTDCASLASIDLPTSVRTLAMSCLENCASLESLTLPEGVQVVEQNALSGTGIKTLRLPATLTFFHECNYLWELTSIEVAEGCERYQSIDGVLYVKWDNQWYLALYPFARENEVFVLPDGCNIGGDTVLNAVSKDAPHLRAVDIGMRQISAPCNIIYRIIVDNDNPYYTSTDGVLYDKEKTTVLQISRYSPEQVVIAEGVKSIGDYASRYTTFSSISLPESLEQIGVSAFYHNEMLESIVIPSGVTQIGICAFSGCSCLDNIVLPEGLTTIEDAAFSDCSSLTSVTIPNSVTSIVGYAFSRCRGLTSVTILNPDAEIGNDGYNVFKDCAAGLTLYGWAGSTTETYANNAGLAFSALPDSGLVAGTCGDNLTWTLDEDGLLTISGTGEMEDYYPECGPWGTGIAQVILEDGVTSIGDWAFYDCGSLTSVTIPESVTSIGESAFSCSGLTSVTLGNGVTSIGDWAFDSCSDLTSVMIGSSVTSIGNYAFAYCRSLTSIAIPDSVTIISDYAFDNCSSLTSMTIPDSVTSIGDYAFVECSDLMSVMIGNGVTSIGNDVFEWCESLTSVTIPDSLTDIGHRAFYECGSLTSLTIPDGVTSISSYAFYHSGLTGVTIPDSVICIGDSAFSSCSSLTSATILGKDTDISSYALDSDATIYCHKGSKAATWATNNGNAIVFFEEMNTLSLPAGLTAIEEDAFQGISAVAVQIPAGVTNIAGNPFADSTVRYIYGVPGTAAQTFADTYGYTFVPVAQ